MLFHPVPDVGSALAILNQQYRWLTRYTLAAFAYMFLVYTTLVLEMHFTVAFSLAAADWFIIMPADYRHGWSRSVGHAGVAWRKTHEDYPSCWISNGHLEWSGCAGKENRRLHGADCWEPNIRWSIAEERLALLHITFGSEGKIICKKQKASCYCRL